MSSLSPLEKETLKYEKKGFKIEQKRAWKYGSRTFLYKKNGLFSDDESVCIYYVDGDITIDCLREFFRDYVKFYHDRNFLENDKAFLMTVGEVDEKLFKDLRKGLIEDNDIRNTVKLLTVNAVEKETEKEEPIKQSKKEPVKKQKKEFEKSIIGDVCTAIEEISFVPSKKMKEMDYETQAYQTLVAKGFDVQYEKARKGARFDIVVGNDEIAVEIKVIQNASQFYGLVGQIVHYKNQFEKIIVLLIDELRNPSVMKQEIKTLEDLDPGKVIVIKK